MMQCLCYGGVLLLSIVSSQQIWQNTDAIHYPNYERKLEGGGVDIDTPGEIHTAQYTSQEGHDSEKFGTHQRHRKLGSTPAGNVSVVRTGPGGSFKIVNNPPQSSSHRGSNVDVGTRSSESEKSDIIFRESGEFQTFSPTVPDECVKAGYCEAAEGYPATHVKKIIKNAPSDLMLHSTEDELFNIEISHRIGELDTYQLCMSYERISFPTSLEHKDGSWHYIMNDDNFRQGVRVETCAVQQVNKSCNPLAYIRQGMEAKCKQKFILRQLQALNSTGGLFQGQFKIPSCCFCEIRDVELNASGTEPS